MAKHITKAFRSNLAQIARVQIYDHLLPVDELVDGLQLLVGFHLFGDAALDDGFLRANRAVIEPVVLEAIERAAKGGAR